MKKGLLTTLVLSLILLSYSCAALQEREDIGSIMSFELNPHTVASVELRPYENGGYGILIVLSDAGWKESLQIKEKCPQTVLIKSKIRTLTKVTSLNKSCVLPWSKESVWTGPAMDINGNYTIGVGHDFYGFSKEEAEGLIKEIMQSETDTQEELVIEEEIPPPSEDKTPAPDTDKTGIEREESKKEQKGEKEAEKELKEEPEAPETAKKDAAIPEEGVERPEEKKETEPDTKEDIKTEPEEEAISPSEEEREGFIEDKEYGLSMILIPADRYSIPIYLKHYLGYLGDTGLVIDNPFYIQTGEVTVGQFRRYVEGLDEESRKKIGDRWEKDWDGNEYPDDKPVEYVSWETAVDYARWLSEKTGWELRLPTLEQWASAVILYSEERPVLRTEKGDIQPITGLRSKGNQPDHLLGNLREWSKDLCEDGRHRLLGEDYMTARDAVGKGACAKDRWKGVGFRVVRVE